ncbi:hypothetical protein [Nostoc sp.]
MVNVTLDVGFVDVFCHNLGCVWFSLMWPHDNGDRASWENAIA